MDKELGVGQIRVHGVAGTPPERILDTVPRRIARRSTDGVSVEMYEAHNVIPRGFAWLRSVSWSSLTSGRPGQAFNVILTPFLLTNMAGWMAPSRSPLAKALGSAAHRVAALTATAIMATGLCWALFIVPVTGCTLLATAPQKPAGIAPDLRCELSVATIDIPHLTDGVRWWLPFALVTLIAVSVLPAWSLWDSRRFRAQLAEAMPDNTDAGAVDADVPDPCRVGPGRWPQSILDDERHPSTTILRWMHWLIAVAMVVGTLGIGLRHNGLYWAGVGATAIAGGITAWVPACDESRGERRTVGPLVAAIFASVPIALALRLPSPSKHWGSAEGQISAYFMAVNWVAGMGGVAIVILVALIFFERTPQSRWAGFNAASTVALSLIVSGVLAAGTSYFATRQLGIAEIRTALGNNEALTIVFVDTGLLVIWWFARCIRQQMGSATGSADFAKAVTSVARAAPERLLARAGFAQIVALLLYLAVLISPEPGGLRDLVIACPAILLAAMGAMEVTRLIGKVVTSNIGCLVRQVAVGAAALLFCWRVSADPLTTFDWLALVLPIALVVQLFVQGVRKRDSRRGAAVVRDAAGFWPRSFHPLVPRPYGAIAIASLRSEIENPSASAEHASEKDDDASCTTEEPVHVSAPQRRDPVVVCGHSQGSVLVLSAVAGLSESARQRVAVLVYGSPVAYLYPAAFPAHFGQFWFTQVHDAVDGRIKNLYRDTDPIAAECGIDGVDVEVGDGDPACMHSGYEGTEEFTAAALDLRNRLMNPPDDHPDNAMTVSASP